MSLSKEPVFSELRNHFVCGYRDISSEPYSGNSGAHAVNGQAVDTTNGAGPHNIQLFVLDADGTVLHCLPGYWNPEDLARELKLAQRIQTVWQDKSMSIQQKKTQFARLQTDHFREHSKETIARSQMQGFDKHAELARGRGADTVRLASSDPDCISGTCSGSMPPENEKGDRVSSKLPGEELVVKSTDEIMHERMAKRPFMAYTAFDTGKFSEYGTHYYDKHEDALDENGKMTSEPGDPPPHQATMRDVIASKSRTHQRPHSAHHQISGRNSVKTYGQLRGTLRHP